MSFHAGLMTRALASWQLSSVHIDSAMISRNVRLARIGSMSSEGRHSSLLAMRLSFAVVVMVA